MAFGTNFSASAWPLLAAQFGESITYTPSGGVGASITALVTRNPLPAHRLSEPGLPEYPIEIFVRQADVATVTVNGDTAAVLIRIDDSGTATRTVARILAQAAGLWHLGLQ